MKKKYSNAPLPFQGQKRKFAKYLRAILKEYPSDAIFVDLFGGSGLLSHIVKSEKPNATVIYNDFNNFKKRLEAIPDTNKILQELRDLLSNYPRGKRITEPYKSRVLNVLRKWNNKGYVDWITISSSLLFSANYAVCFKEFEKSTLYNRVRKSDFELADDYLTGIEVVSCDYKELLSKYKNIKNVVFLVDPPYLSTDTTTYLSDKYWKLTDYLEVLNAVRNTNYFYFTSNKSSIIELCEWLGNTSLNENPFNNAQRIDLKTSLNKNSTYTDTMLFNWCQTV